MNGGETKRICERKEQEAAKGMVGIAGGRKEVEAAAAAAAAERGGEERNEKQGNVRVQIGKRKDDKKGKVE